MPFISRTELETLQTQNQQLTNELAEFSEMRPHLTLAGEIRDEIVAVLEGQGNLDAQQIGEVAYKSVLSKHVDKARDEVAARYEQEHRRGLYKRLLGEIATTEGEEISEGVKRKVETNPDLALELQKSARVELAARATDVVRSKITEEQQEVINKEADRLIALDHLDVQLALDGELDVASEAVLGRLKPGDKVELFFDVQNGRRGRVLLTWTKDANDKQGWVYTSCTEDLIQSNGEPEKIDQNKFVVIASENRDLEAGGRVIQPNRLVVGTPIVLLQKNSTGSKAKEIPLRYGGVSSSYDRYGYGYGRNSYDSKPIVLVGTDFQTKDIKFIDVSNR